MKQNIKKLMIVGVVLGCSLCTRSMSIKQGLKDNKLAQAKFDIAEGTDASGNAALHISNIGSGGLGASVVAAQGLDALASHTI